MGVRYLITRYGLVGWGGWGGVGESCGERWCV